MGQAYLYRGLLLVVAASFLITLFFTAPNLFGSSGIENKLKERNRRIDALLKDKEKMFFHNGTSKQHTRQPVPVNRSEQPVHICYCADENSVVGLVASMRSVQTHTKRSLHFHVLAKQQIFQDLKEWINNTVLQHSRVDIVSFDVTSLEGLIEHGNKSKSLMSYARFFYADYFPGLHGKVIHLDTDTIVQGDIDELSNTKLNRHILAVSGDCQSSGKHFMSYKPQYSSFLDVHHPLLQALHINGSQCSFSSGVYIMDVDRWRRENVTEKLRHWMHLNMINDLWSSEKAGGGSLPAMLIVFYRNVTLLNPLWHVKNLGWRVRQTFSSSFIQHAKLLHWSGPSKPWSGRAQLQEVWDQYYVPHPQDKYKPVRKPSLKQKL